MTDKTKLLPCPFCGAGHDKLIIEHMEGTIVRPAYRVRCDNCGASCCYSDRGDHVEDWNTRAPVIYQKTGRKPMSDRELLELAAKAAGYEIEESVVSGEPKLYLCGSLLEWTPREDDGDALRLAGALRLRISISDEHKHTEVVYYREFGFDRGYGEVVERWGDDRDAATRLAIVRAAAELGRSMP